MNRRFSTIAVLGLLLIGLAVCLKQTLDFYDDLSVSVSSVFLTAEAILAAIIFASVVLLLRRRFAGSGGFTRSKRLEAFAPLRRLLAAVWS
jgi:hypothetical protein